MVMVMGMVVVMGMVMGMVTYYSLLIGFFIDFFIGHLLVCTCKIALSKLETPNLHLRLHHKVYQTLYLQQYGAKS